jgi:transcriptional regulator with XRE-family HTH domain
VLTHDGRVLLICVAMHPQKYDGVVLGANIRRLRKAKGYKYKQFAELAGTQATPMIETGKRGKRPEYATLVAIARALGVTVADLYAEPKPKSKRDRSAGDQMAHNHRVAGATPAPATTRDPKPAPKRRGRAKA